MIKRFDLAKVAVAAVTLLALQGCVSQPVSQGLTDDGQATEIIFPDIQKDATLKEGTFVNRTNLRQIAPDMTKNQVHNLLGVPHFREGMGESVREWDYIFNFRNAADSAYSTCQYKVLFDKDLKTRNFYWLPASCAAALNSPVN
ncbi:outer membrane protein assembly factor BamE [Polaromonas sp. CG_23.6]|uniref:outer membrane protein assembly factor BamE n=1 Tax=Polaromonas sp. CG_23.6 TaxID=2760709 RepID=UPI002476F103|nr:outer membrane protein assembly factor BamE [Polaromonas sp. CG_23.6]MDH6185784.1 outer membrane protein assembly factor BamE (lipoprotein component of BamABCDE complex) [Polaromonas sp. CG_23.6]